MTATEALYSFQAAKAIWKEAKRWHELGEFPEGVPSRQHDYYWNSDSFQTPQMPFAANALADEQSSAPMDFVTARFLN